MDDSLDPHEHGHGSENEHEHAWRLMLDRDWTATELQQLAALGRRLETDPEMSARARDYDRIRALLQTHETTAEPAGGYDAFTERLVNRIASERRGGMLAPPAARGPRWGWRAAAAIGLVALGWLGATMIPRSDLATPTPLASPTHIGTDMLPPIASEQVGAFAQIREDFERRAAWVAFADGKSDIGIASDAIPATTRLVLLRLTMSHMGRAVSQADLIIVPGRSAELELPFEGDQKLCYTVEVSRDDPPRFTLLAELRRPNGHGAPLAALSTTLQLDHSHVASAGQMVTQTGGYELTLGFEQIEWDASL